MSRRHIASGTAKAVVINAGNANACTGAHGEVDAKAMAHAAALALGCADEDVLVCSTGVIGVPLPVERVLDGIAEAAEALDSRDGADAAEAIRTTDTFAKQTAVSFEVGGHRCCAGGMAKGSGMIAPNMATMLSVITTDVPLTSRACDAVLRAACATSFNRLSIDSDTSTNDTVVLLASGAAGGRQIDVDSPDYDAVAEAVTIVCTELARMLARDGEGVTKLVTVTVRGALDDADAEAAARSVADSPLVKTALFGNDANWGRVAMAVGKSSARVDQERLSIVFAGIEVCRNGAAVPFDEDAAYSALDTDEVAIEIDLALGKRRGDGADL